MGDPGILAKSLVKKYFPKFGTIRKSVTYKTMSAPNYSVATGNVIDVVTASYSLQVIWSDFTFTQNSAQTRQFEDSTILSIDKFIIYPALDLPVGAKVGDRVVDDLNLTWSVIGVGVDPADAHFELHLRPLTSL